MPSMPTGNSAAAAAAAPRQEETLRRARPAGDVVRGDDGERARTAYDALPATWTSCQVPRFVRFRLHRTLIP